MEIVQLEALEDNYIYLLRDLATGMTAVIDPSEAKPVSQELKRRGWRLDFILNTHHHWDHVGGNLELKDEHGCQVLASSRDGGRTPGFDRGLAPGEKFHLGDSVGEVLDVPGHTVGHLALFFAKQKALFPGDTLFSLGCGRLFEGTPGQMWETLHRLKQLPDDIQVYCAHEYTLANAAFALSLDPQSQPLKIYAHAASERRRAGRATIPFRLGDEKTLSPFLRAPDTKSFAEVRRKKDEFRGTYADT